MHAEQGAAILYGSGQVTWLIVIVGWFIVNHQNNNRETRKEILAKLDGTINLINEVEGVAIKFHSGDYDKNISRSILTQIDRISRAIASSHMPMPKNMTYKVVCFRKSITLLNFDESEHVFKALNDPLFDKIAAETQSLVDAIEDAYAYTYHRTVFRKISGKLSAFRADNKSS
ncbi:MAG: hypothetical protein ABW168_02730 [Sedimenticola sp.]